MRKMKQEFRITSTFIANEMKMKMIKKGQLNRSSINSG